MSKSKRRKHNRAFLDAVLLNDISLARHLLDEGADANARDALGDGETALILAAQRDGAPMVRLLLERGAEVDARDENGRTALLCAPHGSETFEVLLAWGADPHARDGEGYTHLMRAVERVASPEEVRELIERGVDINAKGSGGETALSIASELGLVAVAELLQRAGAIE